MKVGCVLVTYNPDRILFKNVLSSVSAQVDSVFIADNSPAESQTTPFNGNNIIYYPMQENCGIAAAQNVGITYFLEHNFDYIFFLDQDSLVEEQLVEKLLDDYIFLEKAGVNVVAVGPSVINRTSNKEYAQRTKKTAFENMVEANELTSSATLVAAGSFDQVGLMDESLFIDGVDHEWCWRAKAKGNFCFFIDKTIYLSHQLGEGDRFFALRKVAIPTPFRTYYQFRNYFWLLRRKYVPLRWKVKNGGKYFVKLFYYPLFVTPRKAYLANIFSGIRDGLFTKQ